MDFVFAWSCIFRGPLQFDINLQIIHDVEFIVCNYNSGLGIFGRYKWTYGIVINWTQDSAVQVKTFCIIIMYV